MAGLLDLFSGRSSDIYGNGLLTPEQRGGLGNIGLLALAGKLGQLAGPSFSPVPDFGAALGQAAGAYGASQEGAGTAALNAILTAQKGRKLQQELDYGKQLGPILAKLAGQWPGADGGTAATESTGSTGGGTAAPLGAGGGGGGGGTYWTPEGLKALQPTEGRYDQIHYPSGNPSTASGAYGFLDSTWREQAAKAGVDINQYPRAYLAPPAVQDAVAAITPIHHWTGVDANGKPFNAAAQRLAANPRYVAGAAPTAAAPAPAGGGGLLAPTAPNPLSDAEPMLPIVRTAVAPGGGLLTDPNRITVPPPASGPAAPGNPQPGDMVNGLVFKGGDPKDPRSWAVAPRGAITPSGGGAALEEPPGFAGRQLVAQLLARPPIDDLNQYRQVAGPGAADAAAAPRAPLPTMGPTGVELPPLQGPLAAPAPAAAAPVAPGPGLLSPQGAPAAALPRVNPAYDALLRNLGLAGALAEGAGLKNVLGPIQQALEASPAYKGQVKTAEEAASDPFIRGRAEQKAQLDRVNDLAKSGGIIGPNGEVVPWQGFQELLKANERAKAEGTEESQQRQKILEFHLDNLKNGKVVDPRTGETLPARGAIELAQQQAAATTTAQERARAEVAAGTAPGLAGRTEFAKGIATQDLEHRKAAESARDSLEGLDDARAMVNSGIFAGAGADWKLRLAKAGQVLGFDNDRIANTENYIQLRAREVLNILGSRALGAGTGISSSDRDFATGVANGSTQLDERTIKRMLDIQEKVSTNAYNRWNRRADELEKASPGTGARIEPPIRAGALPEGVPPGSVPGTPTIHGKPTWRTPNGKVLVVE